MRLAKAKALKKGDTVAYWKTGAAIVLAKDPEHYPVERLVMLTDAFDGRRYVHTEVVPYTGPKTPPAVIHRF